jgi:hypothetical protein
MLPCISIINGWWFSSLIKEREYRGVEQRKPFAQVAGSAGLAVSTMDSHRHIFLLVEQHL